MKYKLKALLLSMSIVSGSIIIASGWVHAYGGKAGEDKVGDTSSLDTANIQSGTERNAQAFQKPADDVLRKQLNRMQYRVTQKDGTEPPFQNEYWDEKREGIYVDIVSGEPLFSSKDKYRSGTGWPSFTRPISSANITEHEDRNLFAVRTEVRSKGADSHLGHVFNDGPAPTGLRYCINSAALRFIPKDDLEKEGYSQLAGLFR